MLDLWCQAVLFIKFYRKNYLECSLLCSNGSRFKALVVSFQFSLLKIELYLVPFEKVIPSRFLFVNFFYIIDISRSYMKNNFI